MAKVKLTQLGKFLRKYRVDRNLKQKDMAKSLDVSTAFLSYVENGIKQPPKSWRELLPEVFEFSGKLTKEFHNAFDLSSDINKRIENIIIKNPVRERLLNKLLDETIEDEVFERILLQFEDID